MQRRWGRADLFFREIKYVGRFVPHCYCFSGARKLPTYVNSLATYPSVGFASQAKGCVNKEGRFLTDAPLCRFSEKILGCEKCPQSHFLIGEKELFC